MGARRPEPSARISGRVVRAAATGERIRSGTSRKETVGARRPELRARISGRVVLTSGTWASAFDRDRHGRSIKGRTCEIASRHGCAVQGSAESKSKADIGASAAGLAVGTVGREVKAKVEITDRDGQSIKGRTCKIAGRHRCTEPGSARSESKTDIGANAAGLAMGRVGQGVEARDETRDRDGQSIKGRTCKIASRQRRTEHGKTHLRRVKVRSRHRRECGRTCQGHSRPRGRSKPQDQRSRRPIGLCRTWNVVSRRRRAEHGSAGPRKKIEVRTRRRYERGRTCSGHSRPKKS